MEQKFNEQEQGQIFARAIELQRQAGHVLTLSQMEATALEAGIDPQFLQAAVAELRQGGISAGVDLLPRWRVAALCLVAMAQVYTVSGQVLSSQRDFYIPIALVAAVGVLFAGRGFLKSLGAFAAVSVLTAFFVSGFLLLTGASADHLPVAVRQMFLNLLVQSFTFAVGHIAAALFLNRGKHKKTDLRSRLSAATAPAVEETNAREAAMAQQFDQAQP